MLAFSLFGVLAVAFLADRALLVNRVSFTKTADVLEERAREIIALAQYTETPTDTARGVAVNREYVQWMARTNTSPSKWDSIGDGTAPVLDFWYRTSPHALRPLSSEWRPQPNDPPLGTSGMVTVVVDDRGRLVEFVAMPPQFDPSAPTASAVDWNPLFQAAACS